MLYKHYRKPVANPLLMLKMSAMPAKNWYCWGGYGVLLFIPHTPRMKLAKRMRVKEMENNRGRSIRFNLIEKGGVTLEKK